MSVTTKKDQDIESAFGGNVVQPKAITNAKVFKAKKQKRKSPLQCSLSLHKYTSVPRFMKPHFIISLTWC